MESQFDLILKHLNQSPNQPLPPELQPAYEEIIRRHRRLEIGGVELSPYVQSLVSLEPVQK